MPCICGGDDQVVAPRRQVKQSVAEAADEVENRGVTIETRGATGVSTAAVRDRKKTPYAKPYRMKDTRNKDQDKDARPPSRIVKPKKLRNRVDTEDMPIHQGAFHDANDADFDGKVLYAPCRGPVYTPSDWDPSLAERSEQLPDASLELEFVYGYAGKFNSSKNVFYNSDDKVVYYTAGLGIVYEHDTHSQSFYHGHNDDISALTLCPVDVEVNGATYPAKSLVATGQVSHVEEGAYITVWDSMSAGSEYSELVRIDFGKEARGFCALGFSPDGQYLACSTLDNSNTIHVYDWKSGTEVGSGIGLQGEPPAINGIEWNPFDDVTGMFVTFGRRHMKMWTNDGENWTAKNITFGSLLMQNVLSAQWLPPRPNGSQYIVAGCDNGQLYLVDVDKAKAIKSVAAHAAGPKYVQPNGSMAHIGVRGLCLCKDGTVLLSGGADGKVLSWDASDGIIKDNRFAADAVQLTNPFNDVQKLTPAVRALDYSANLDRILVGTSNCDVVEIADGEVEMLMDGHAGDIWGVAFHPAKPEVFASVADSGHLHLVDADARKMINVLALDWKPRAVTFSSAPVDASYHLAVGGAKGVVRILDEDSLDILKEIKDSKQGISDLMYSPNNKFLAVGTYDAWIDVYAVDKGYKRIARCIGHSATVRGIDWSEDSCILMSNSNDYELLFWDARTGKQIVNPDAAGKDVNFATYTCMLGFPVMGIWHPEADGTDVNSLNRSHNEQLLVTADDHGRVKLFNYPCVIDDAPAHVYTGHSSHVMCARFSSDDSMVCTGGGHDKSVFQYRVKW